MQVIVRIAQLYELLALKIRQPRTEVVKVKQTLGINLQSSFSRINKISIHPTYLSSALLCDHNLGFLKKINSFQTIKDFISSGIKVKIPRCWTKNPIVFLRICVHSILNFIVFIQKVY